MVSRVLCFRNIYSSSSRIDLCANDFYRYQLGISKKYI